MTEQNHKDVLPGSIESLWRSLKHGFKAQPLLLLVSGVTRLFAASIDALFALGLAFFASGVADKDQTRTIIAAAALAFLITGSWLFDVVGQRLDRRLTERASIYMESHVARLQSSIPTLEHQERVDYLDRISLLRNHASALSELFGSLFSTTGAFVRLVITLLLLMAVHPGLIVLAIFALPALYVSNWRGGLEHKTREALGQQERRARQLFLVGTSAPESKEVRINGIQAWLRARRSAIWDERYFPLARLGWVSSLYRGGAMSLFGVALVVAAWVIGTSENATPANMMLVLVSGSRLSQYVSQAASDMHFFRTIWLDCSRRLAWLENYAQEENPSASGIPPTRLNRGLRIQNLSFNYPGSAVTVLDNINIEIPAGKVVAIVGANGAGKSTFVKLLCGLYRPTTGTIWIDGTDLHTLDSQRWRKQLSGAFQDFFMFEYQMKQSVGLGDLPKIDDTASVTLAIENAGATSIVSRLPTGLETQLGPTWDSGVGLSHGQWQRVALARGYMRQNPLLLVLDEPGSALDAETEHELFGKYAQAARDRERLELGGITLLISHRFSTVQMADMIIVFDGSTIAEYGSHEELTEHNGIYADLYRLQAESYS